MQTMSPASARKAWLCLAMLATMATLWAGPARADLPPKSVGPDTAFVMVIDMDALTPDAITAAKDKMMAMLPPMLAQQANPAEFNEGLAEFKTFRDKFMNLGGESMMVAMEFPNGQPAPDAEPAVYLKMAEGKDPSAVLDALKAMDDGPQDVTSESLGGGWHALKSDEIGSGPVGDDPAASKMFGEELALVSNAPIRFTLRITDVMRQEMTAQANAGGGGMNPAAGLMQAALPLTAVTGGVELGESPALKAAMAFPGDAEAQSFNQQWTGLLMMGQGLLSAQIGQFQGQPDMPTAADVQAVFQSLNMTQDGSRLSLALDAAFAEKLSKFAPIAMMMMMGGGF